MPVQPVKGYSVTFDSDPKRQSLRIPIIDDCMHAVVVPHETAIRAAGTAEFTGYDLRIRPDRIRNLLNLLQEFLPQERFDPAVAKCWSGLRAMSADGVPIIGRTQVENLWVNTGHGHLGWTVAAASGHLLAELMSRECPSIDPAP
jgi:D-amino-acid dehydrogenase